MFGFIEGCCAQGCSGLLRGAVLQGCLGLLRGLCSKDVQVY